MPQPGATIVEEPPDNGGATLAVLVKRFPRLSETFVLNEFLELRRQGLPVRLIAITDPKERHTHPDAEALRPEVSYLRGGGPAAWPALVPEALPAALRNAAGTFRGIRFGLGRRSVATWKHLAEALVLLERLRRMRASHLHAHFAHGPAAIAYLAHLVGGVPFSFTAHAKDLYTTPPAYLRQRAHAASFVVTCTEANRDYLAGVLGKDAGKVVVCRHGVPAERFERIARTPVPGRILSVGRLVPKKGFAVLIRALGMLADRDIAFECCIIGGGPLVEEMRARASSLGIAGRVRIKGARPQGAVLDEYARAEVFALAPVVTADGDRDGIPNVLAEAMASGIPVVSTAMSGIPELVQDGRTGILVPPGDASALAAALERLLRDEALRKRLGDAGRDWVHERCDLPDSVRPLAALFRERLKKTT